MKKIFFLLGIILSLSINAQNWSLTGNAGTTPGTNFIGTTDIKDLVFKTNNSERIRLTSQGRLGIGHGSSTLSYDPYAQLVVEGDCLIALGESAKGFRVFDLPNDYNHFRVDSESQNVFIQEFPIGYTIIGSSGVPTCTDCNEYKLFVKKGIRTEKVKVDIAANNGWADYVFKKDYRLRPLAEVEKFIAENGHLPEVPSEKEAIENGIELKEMNILLLKKVEELTLYTLQQQKQIDEQQKREAEQNRRIEQLENKLNNTK